MRSAPSITHRQWVALVALREQFEFGDERRVGPPRAGPVEYYRVLWSTVEYHTARVPWIQVEDHGVHRGCMLHLACCMRYYRVRQGTPGY